ncbi:MULTISPECIES: metal ABC transporter permease [unclassified Listeria]|uniref:metal ABC transporter permease n=1 Tax=unclassified Listeria TaxID=2642072 RepID=UPI000B587493|nr:MULTISPECIES: metal ABC transporter permease [unclassified Listeria]
MEFVQGLFEYQFLQKALLTSVAVGIVCGVIGSFIILRGMSLMGDAISHAVLPGVAISYMAGINFFFGAVLFGILAAFGIGFVNQKSTIKSDTAIGIVFSAFFALGIILITLAKSSTDLYHILFGNVLAVRSSDMWLTIGIAAIVVTLIGLFYKELFISSFDPVVAETYGYNTRFLHYFLMLMLTLVTVAALQTVGIILVVALLITPAATAYLITHRLKTMIFLAASFGAVSSVIGLFLSYRYNLASGATIVLTATLLFIIIFISKNLILVKKKGVLG